MSLLTPDIGLLFWMALSFSVVLFVLIRYAFPVILGAIDRRGEYISSSLEKAHQAEVRLAEVEKEAQAVMDKAAKERGEMIRQGQQTAAGVIEKARAEAEAQAAKRLERAKQEAEELRRRTLDEAMGEIAGLSVRIAGKLIEEELHEGARQKQLIEKFIKEDNA